MLPAGRAELAMELLQAAALADEDDLAPDACGPHQLERERRVGGAEKTDRERARDDRRRDQPGRREVVAGAEADREDDQRDEDQRRDDAPDSRPMLAAGVETGLEEHEHGDRDQERQPLAGAGSPEQRPVDGVAVEHRAQHERDVEAEREPDDVDRHEQHDADRAPERADHAGGGRRGRGATP